MTLPRSLWCMVISVLIGPLPLSAAPLVAGDAPRYNLAGRLEILRDDSRAMSISQVMAASARWQPIPDPEPNFGFTSAVYWVRFQVASNTDHALVLSFQYANVDSVNLYVVFPDGRIGSMTSGTSIPFDERPLANRYPVFPLPITRGQEAWCYMQVRDTHSLFPLSVWSEIAFVRADRQEQMVIGLFLGLFFIVALFNLLFYLATRDQAYLAYVLFVLSYVLFEVAFRGIGGEYLWPHRTWIDDAVEVTSSSVAITMGLVFTRRFLQTRVWAPLLHRVLGVLLVAGAVNTICTLVLPFEVMVEVTNGFLLVSAVILIPNAIIVLRRGYRAARFYLVAWVMLLPGCMIFALFNVGVIPSTLLTMNALSLGASLEMILLFLAIVDRILILRRDSEKMQQERLEAMEKRLYSDTLTELPNRNRLIADLQPGRTITMILVNIDHFKEINDYFGQKAGDHVIRELGERIRRTVAGRAGAVYRLHADEFAVVIDSAYTPDQLEEVGRALTAECQDHAYLYENEALRLDVSIGIAVTDTRHLEKADMALSVTRTRKTFVIYRPELEVIKRYADNLHWLHIMRESIEQDRIVPFFQPILNNSSGAIEKFESLMRIRTTTGEIIPPGAFLTIAKKSKLYPELSRVIIEKTVRMMRS
ncbi:MAG TPA: 7TM diverse intracellular signaling domain-containing protein, partial [Spirochaetia bacterium]|nr:7TM diverse intracellular signaling domain-containing protein [Spirochaetia bacterium]